MAYCSGTWVKPSESSCWKMCCGICALGSVLLLFLHPQNLAVPPGPSSSKVAGSSFQVQITWRSASNHPPSPDRAQPPLFLPVAEREGGRGHVTWVPGTFPTGWWPIERPLLQTSENQRGKVTCLWPPSQDNGKAKTANQFFWPIKVWALLYFLQN